MKKSIVSFILGTVLALAGCVGCASRTDKIVSTELTIHRGTNSAHLVSPKDVSFESFSLDSSGKVELKNYRSTANEAAIKSSEAQAAMYQHTFDNALALGKQAAEAGLRVAGVPIPTSQANPQPVASQQPAPAPAPPQPFQAPPVVSAPVQPGAGVAAKKTPEEVLADLLRVISAVNPTQSAAK